MSSSSSSGQAIANPLPLNMCNNCLFLIRQLRTHVLKTHNHVFAEVYRLKTENPKESLAYSEALVEKVKVDFDNLEAYARTIQKSLPQFEKLERMKTIFTQDIIDNPRNELVESMVDTSNWNEANYQLNTFLAEFQRNYRMKTSVMVPRPVAYTNWTTVTPHQHFQKIFDDVQKEFTTKKFGIYPTQLENSSISSVVELKFGVSSDKQFVCTLKMIMVENNGQIEMVQFIAPHEEWSYTDELGQKRVDLTKESRYLVYRKLTTQGNLHLVQSINPHFDWRNRQNFIQACYIFRKFQQIFEAQCRTCKKVMRDFLPPLIFDFRKPKEAALHETCK